MIEREKIQKEVDDNFNYFKKNYQEIKNKYPKKEFILLKNKKEIAGFDTLSDAETAAELMFEDELFSIQKVNQENIDLGYQSYALF